MNFISKPQAPAFLSLFFIAAFADPALAAAGTQSVNNLFQTILGVLQGVSLVVVTISILWAGYKMIFTAATIQHVAGPFLGAIVVAAAPWLAELLVG